MFLLGIAFLLFEALAGATAPPAPAIEQELDVRIRMRDGVELSTNVFRPSSPARVPTILVRTPYDNGTGLAPYYRPFVEHGYALVIQDVRGRYDSQGVFEPLRQESNDSEDTLDWIARQPWSSRRIGMMGGSYLGIVQWKAALLDNTYLKAIFPVVSGCDDYRDRFYSEGGAFKLGQRLEWMAENVRIHGMMKPDFARFIWNVPLRTSDRVATGRVVDFYQQALNHPAYDAFWKDLSTRERLDRVRIPVLAAGGWYDNFAESDLEAFRILRSHGRANRLVIGPWPHNMSAEFPGTDFGPQAKLALRELQMEWFDYWVKENGEDAARNAESKIANPPLRIFVMGANRWRDEEEWPLSRARTVAFYLGGRGRANTLNGDGLLEPVEPRRQASDQYVYDPKSPVPTTGGAVCCNPKVLPWGPLDQRGVEKRRDVLVYTSAPLTHDTEVTGPIRAVLYVSTSQPDTDFTAKLVDVFPGGYARNLTDGVLRLRYRDSLEKPAPARPGQIYPIAIDAGVTSNVFLKDHRIRLEISSSNFPRFDRNPNTGRPVADEHEFRRANETVYHGRRMPSRLLLPVVPYEESPFAGSRHSQSARVLR
ncbi:MAG: CocE/NonD family hydrolase [Bryobacteraceae bacterium]